jgi:hypothetical protein
VSDQILVREDGSMQRPREALEGMFEMLDYFQDDFDRGARPATRALSAT